jgi:hypothetical protein
MSPMPGGMLPGSVLRRTPAGLMTSPLLRSAASLAAAASMTSGMVLAWRRLAGGFAGADPGLVWMTLGGGLILLGIAEAGRRVGGPLACSIAARVGIVLAVGAVAVPPRAGDWASILALAVAAAVGVLQPPSTRRGRGGERRRPPAPQPRGEARRSGSPFGGRGSAAAVPTVTDEPSPTAEPPLASIPPPPTTVLHGRLQQRLERYESAEGVDCVSGHVRLSIPAGGKVTHAHVGFCPAFAATPSVEVTTDYDGVEAVVTAAEVLPWGVRIECRLSEPAEEPLEIPVDLLATVSR